MRLQEVVWGGTGGGRAPSTVQGFPGVSRKAVTLLRRDSVDVYLVSFRPFYLFFFRPFFINKGGERNGEILRCKFNLLLGPIYVS